MLYRMSAALKILLAACNLSLLLYLEVGSAKSTYPQDNPDMYRNTSELISSKHYPVMEHEVTTKDGYILTIQRIPCSRNCSLATERRLPILLLPGNPQSSSTYVLNSEKNSLGFVLADQGYDVWLGNLRGSTYGKKHKTLSTESKIFWDFSIDEFTKYDLPAIMDYILLTTGRKSLSYVGFSQGGLLYYTLLADIKAYNSKVHCAVNIAPALNIQNTRSLIGRFMYTIPADSYRWPEDNVEALGKLSPTIARSLSGVSGEEIYYSLNGPSTRQLNVTRLPVYFSHYPAGTSFKNLAHIGQLIQGGTLTKFDYGPIRNKARYGKVSIPIYELSNVKSPSSIIYGDIDWMVEYQDLESMFPVINNSLVFAKKVKDFGHLDLIWGRDVPTAVFPTVLKQLEVCNKK